MDLLVGLHIPVCPQWVTCPCDWDVVGAHTAWCEETRGCSPGAEGDPSKGQQWGCNPSL